MKPPPDTGHGRSPRSELRTFGSLDLRDAEGRELATLLSQPKRLALLVYLAAHSSGRFHRRDTLLGLLWPEIPQDRARNALNKSLYFLRRALGKAVIVSRGDEEVGLDRDGLWCDAEAFGRAIDENRHEDAVELFRGPFLPGFYVANAPEFMEWLDRERDRLAERYAGALETLATAAARRGDPSAAIGWWRRAVEHDSLSTRAIVGLMNALVANGERGAAILEAERHAEILRRELDAEPDPDVRELLDRLRLHPLPAGAERLPPAPAAPLEDRTPAGAAPDGRALADARARHHRHRSGIIAGVTAFVALLVVSGLYLDLADGGRGPTSASSADAGKTRHLQATFVGDAEYPALSPDGRTIAFVRNKWRDVYLEDLDGGGILEVDAPLDMVYELRWSPDGARVLMRGLPSERKESYDELFGTNVTYVVPRLGGVPRRLTTGYRPAWSPDGRRIASFLVPGRRILLTDVATDDTTSIGLPGDIEWAEGLDWSPRGDRLAYAAQHVDGRYTLGTISVDGGAPARIQEGARIQSPLWSPGGDAVYYLRGQGFVFPYFEDAGQLFDLVKVPVSTASGKRTGEPRVLIAGLQSGSQLSASRDGARLAHTRQIIHSNLWLITMGASPGARAETRPITKGTAVYGVPSVSPDGSRIAVGIGEQERANIFVLPLEGGEPRQLTFFDTFSGSPVWSPDGDRIAFGSIEGGGRRVWSVPAEGGTPRPFEGTEIGQGFELAWAPAREILYQATGNTGFVALDPVTGRRRPLHGDGGWMLRAIPSPDGRSAAVLWHRPPGVGIHLLSLDEGPARLLVDDPDVTFGPSPVGWGPDGRWLYLWSLVHGSMYTVPVEGGSPERLFDLDCGDEIVGIAAAPDGRRFVCSGARIQTDVWIVENFDPR